MAHVTCYKRYEGDPKISREEAEEEEERQPQE